MINVSRMILGAALAASFFMQGCASSQMKARKEQRDKVVATSHLYCDFVNGEIFPDVEVQLNLEMAKHCTNDKAMSISQYRTTNDNMGMIYCCATATGAEGKKLEAKADTKADKTDARKPATASTTDELGD